MTCIRVPRGDGSLSPGPQTTNIGASAFSAEVCTRVRLHHCQCRVSSGGSRSSKLPLLAAS